MHTVFSLSQPTRNNCIHRRAVVGVVLAIKVGFGGEVGIALERVRDVPVHGNPPAGNTSKS